MKKAHGHSKALLWMLITLVTLVLNPTTTGAEKEIKPESGAEIGFLRFVDKGPHGSHIDTAIASYSHPDGQQVDLIAVIHVADAVYYKELNDRFKSYDALLYELIGDTQSVPNPNEPNQSMVSTLQRVMKTMLDLDFQLDVIDYSAPNFVHADMDAKTFRTEQKDRGESIFGLMMKSMMTGWEQQAEGTGPQMTVFQLLAAFASEDRALSLKYLLGRDFGQMEQMIQSIDETSDGEGSVILSGRNKVAMEVLKKEMETGKKKLALFYGAGHMPDMEKRLFEMGFQFKSHKWMTAWQIGTPQKKSPPHPSPEIKKSKRQHEH